jgi:hypothetical protein
LVSYGISSAHNSGSFGAGETQIIDSDQDDGINIPTGIGPVNSSWKAASSSPATESMTTNWSNSRDLDEAILAIKFNNVSSVTSTSTTTYRARIDDGSHTSYSLANNMWTVYDKNGTRYLYGSDDTGRQYDVGTGTSTRTHKWMLQEVRDTNGNYVKYTYLRHGNELYPYKITYTGHDSTDGIMSVQFATSTRPDSRVSYIPGLEASSTERISE